MRDLNAQAQAWRHGRRRHRGQHGHRPSARLPRAGLPLRDLHARHAEPREDRPFAHAGRGRAPRAGSAVRRRAELQPPGARPCARDARRGLDGPVRQHGQRGRALPHDGPRDLGADAGRRRCVRRVYRDWRHACGRRAVLEGDERRQDAGVARGPARQRPAQLRDQRGSAE